MTALVRLLRRNLEVLPGLAVFFLLISPYWFSLPVWDGQAFIECFKGAAHESFNWRYFLCYAHPSILFVTLFAIPEHFFTASPYFLPGSVLTMHAMMFALGAASIVAFHILARRLFSRESALTRMLCILLYATQPVILSNAISYNFDIGVTYFFVILLALLLSGHEKWAAVAGLMMVFTKESGVLLYALTLFGFWFLTVRRSHRSTPSALLAFFKRWWLMFPFFLYVLHLLWQYHLGNLLLHENIAPSLVLRAMTTFDLLHERFLALLAEILLFQFTWFQTLIMACGFLLWLWRFDRSGIRTSDERSTSLGLLAFLYVTGILALTRILPFIAIRYVMPLFPLGILLFTASAIALGRRTAFARAVMMVALTMNVCSLFRSLDPVTARFFGTFPFGSHQMYKIGLYDNCCIFGRDDLVYNFEYRNFFSLEDRAFQVIHPNQNTVLAMHYEATIGHRDPLDPVTFLRTWSPGSFLPAYVTIDDVPHMNPPPKELYVIDFPNFPTEVQRSRIEETYVSAGSGSIVQNGYAIRLFKYVLSPVAKKKAQKREEKIAATQAKLLSLLKKESMPAHRQMQQSCRQQDPTPSFVSRCMTGAKLLLQNGVMETINATFDPK